MWGEDIAPPLWSCAQCVLLTANTCVGSGNQGIGQEKVSKTGICSPVLYTCMGFL